MPDTAPAPASESARLSPIDHVAPAAGELDFTVRLDVPEGVYRFAVLAAVVGALALFVTIVFPESPWQLLVLLFGAVVGFTSAVLKRTRMGLRRESRAWLLRRAATRRGVYLTRAESVAMVTDIVNRNPPAPRYTVSTPDDDGFTRVIQNRSDRVLARVHTLAGRRITTGHPVTIDGDYNPRVLHVHVEARTVPETSEGAQ